MKPSRSTKVVTAMDNVPSWSSIALCLIHMYMKGPHSLCVCLPLENGCTAEMVLSNSALLAEVMITTIIWSGPHDYRWEEFSGETRREVNCLHWVMHGVSGKARNSSPVLRSSCAYNTTLLFISQEFLCKQACSYFAVSLCSTPSQLHPYSTKMCSNTCEREAIGFWFPDSSSRVWGYRQAPMPISGIHGFWGSRLPFSNLKGKHFTHWAISLALLNDSYITP